MMLINTRIISNPVNWVIVPLMIVFGLVAMDVILGAISSQLGEQPAS